VRLGTLMSFSAKFMSLRYLSGDFMLGTSRRRYN